MLTFEVGTLFREAVLELLALFALGLKLSVKMLFVAVEACSSFLHVSLVLFAVNFAPLFISLDSSFNLKLKI